MTAAVGGEFAPPGRRGLYGSLQSFTVALGLRLDETPEFAAERSWETPLPGATAYDFAVLGFLTVHGLPGTEPASTAARRPSVLGSVAPGRDGLRLPPPVSRRPARLLVE